MERATCSNFLTGLLRLARHQRPPDRIAIFSVRPTAGNMSGPLYEKTEVTRALKEEKDHLGLHLIEGGEGLSGHICLRSITGQLKDLNKLFLQGLIFILWIKHGYLTPTALPPSSPLLQVSWELACFALEADSSKGYHFSS